MAAELPEELTQLVRLAIDALGEMIKAHYGVKFFNVIEKIRSDVKQTQKQNQASKLAAINKLNRLLHKKPTPYLQQIAHCFALYMETINRCESTYRAYRLQNKANKPAAKQTRSIIFVFTAHPTEARSLPALGLFKRLEASLLASLQGQSLDQVQSELKMCFSLLLQTSLAKQQAPTVADEAEHIYSAILHHTILDQQLQCLQQGIDVRFRTWVGGDKDGHPYVDARAMQQSWQLAREQFIKYIDYQLTELDKTLCYAKQAKLHTALARLKTAVGKLSKIKTQDAKYINAYTASLDKLESLCQQALSVVPLPVQKLKLLIQRYPALVVPLELREDASLVHKAYQQQRGSIYTMLKTLKQVCGSGDPRYYVKGFILSMTESAADIQAGVALAKLFFKPLRMPIVPLFETAHALENSVSILKTFFQQQKGFQRVLKLHLENKFEVMLGYSDSAKESGVLLSRLLIARTLHKLDTFLRTLQITPIFFHGSGGSIERGGGAVEEQVSWLPHSARANYKATVQGEMVTRNFANAAIMRGICDKINHLPLTKRFSKLASQDKTLYELAERAAAAYQGFIQDPKMRTVIQKATPYSYLDELRIGSRPTARANLQGGFKIRAIPWMLCWTQTRLLIPVWWGVGSAWQALSGIQRQHLRQLAKTAPLFHSYLMNLGFTLAKVEIAVFKAYLTSVFDKKTSEEYYAYFKQELELTQKFYYDVLGMREYMAHKPWLQTSIDLRSPMILPLNLIQIIAMRRGAMALLRETTTGIASGMLTTG